MLLMNFFSKQFLNLNMMQSSCLFFLLKMFGKLKIITFQNAFCAKTNEIGIRKKWGGGKQGPPPQGPLLYCSILIPHCQKFFWKNLSIFVDHTKIFFGRIVFRPNIQALEKKCCQNGNFHFTPFVLAGNGQNVSKKFLVNVLTLYSSNQGFVKVCPLIQGHKNKKS